MSNTMSQRGLINKLIESNWNDLESIKIDDHLYGILTEKYTQSGQTVGQFLATGKDYQALRNYLKLLEKLENKEVLKQSLLNIDTHSYNIGHSIAQHQIQDICRQFLSLIENKNSNLLPDLLEATTKDGWNIGHLIMRYQASTVCSQFFSLIENKNSNLLPDLLEATINDGWKIGHIIMRRQASTVCSQFLSLIKEKTPDLLPDLLEATTKDGWNIGHYIAEHQNEKICRQFFELIKNYDPKLLHEFSMGLINSEKHKNNGEIIAPVIHQVLKSDLELKSSYYQKIKIYKGDVLTYIDKKLNPSEKIQALKKSLLINASENPLSKFFNFTSTITLIGIGKIGDPLKIRAYKLLKNAKACQQDHPQFAANQNSLFNHPPPHEYEEAKRQNTVYYPAK